MKRVCSILSGLALAAVIAAPSFSAEKAPKPTTLKGEVIDLVCYSVDGKKATGDAHKDCAAKCINEGNPVGLLTKDGTVWILVAAEHGDTKGQLAPFAAQKVVVTGTKGTKGGVKVFHFSKVEAMAATPAK